MKKTIITLLFLGMFLANGWAQKIIEIDGKPDQHINTLFKKEKRDGFYWAYATGYSPINNDNGLVFSGRAGWIMDHWFAFGFTGTGFINNFDQLELYDYRQPAQTDLFSLAGGYGGLFIEPIAFPLKAVHVSFPVVLGAGGLTKVHNYVNDDFLEKTDLFYLVEPGLELEVNVTRWLRFAIYGTWRFTSDIHLENVSAKALENYTAGAIIKVGLF
jgi:hypothetical protein